MPTQYDTHTGHLIHVLTLVERCESVYQGELPCEYRKGHPQPHAHEIDHDDDGVVNAVTWDDAQGPSWIAETELW